MSVTGIDSENRKKYSNLMVCFNYSTTMQEHLKAEGYAECYMHMKNKNVVYCKGHYIPEQHLNFTEKKMFK